MDTVARIRGKLDHRNVLIGLHIAVFVSPLIYFADGYISNPLPAEHAHNQTVRNYMIAQHSTNLYCGLLTSLISILLTVVGIFSISLHEDSSMVVHNGLGLWLMHLILFSDVHHYSHFHYYKSSVLSYITATGDALFSLIMMLLMTLQIVIGSKLLRRNNSVWPRSNLMKLFSLDCPLLIARLVVSCFCFGVTNYVLFMFNRYQSDQEFSLASLSAGYSGFGLVILNLFICLENIVTTFWGIPHRKLMGIEAILSCGLLFLHLIITTATDAMPRYSDLVPWYAVAIILGLIHGTLNLAFPNFISKVPSIFDRDAETRRNTNFDSSNGQPSDGGQPYSRMLSSFFGGDTQSIIPDENSPNAVNQLTLRQLFKESHSFFRNFCYLVVCGVIFAMLGSALTSDNIKYISAWAPILLLCATTSVIFRTFPPFLMELITRTPTPKPLLIQVFTSMLIESTLLIISMLGSWIEYSIYTTMWQSAVYRAAAGVAIILLILHGLHLRSYLKSN